MGMERMEQILGMNINSIKAEDIKYCNEHWGEYKNSENNHYKNYYMKVLKDKKNKETVKWGEGIEYQVLGQLFHSNSVKTSLDYIKKGFLYSRRYGYDTKTVQTYQKSDDLDKKLGIDNDIFFDACDIPHYAESNTSAYGPVMFVFDPEILSADDIAIRIMQFNPVNLDMDNEEETKTYGDLFYLDTEKLREALLKNHPRYFLKNYGHHVTVVNKGTLEFGHYLKAICIEKHPSGNGQEKQLKKLISQELENKGINDVKLLIRPQVPSTTTIYACPIEEQWAFPE